VDSRYAIADTSQIFSPALIVYRDILDANLARMIRISGGVDRLRPHCKTHKMPAVIERELKLGITRHKCATFAEAEMVAECGVKDIVLAYNMVGPNIARAVAFRQKFPDAKLIVTADDERMIDQLGAAMVAAGTTIGVLLDMDTGLHRTGVLPGPKAADLYRRICRTAGLTPEGFHWYDGHNHQTDLAERKAAVLGPYAAAKILRAELLAEGLSVPRIVCGGTGSFPVFAELTDPEIELSPGTCVLHDCGYGTTFPDMDFEPAALLLTRVISRPTPTRLTLDVGNKAVASDPPRGTRVQVPDLPDAEQVLHNEEHLVLETPLAGRYQPGDELLAIPRHVCPTSALYKDVYVVSGGNVVDRWPVTARDRCITI
jgi:D-serine deaminase-like pyridoxal phosphate-dependent protein